MASDDYVDSLSGLPQPSAFSGPLGPGAMSGWAASERMRQVQPLLDILKKQKELGLEKSQTELTEFLGKSATEQREQARQEDIQKSKDYITNSPYNNLLVKEHARVEPYINDEKILDAQEKARHINDMKGGGQFIQEWGNNFNDIDKIKPGPMRTAAIQNAVDAWQAKNPSIAASMPSFMNPRNPDYNETKAMGAMATSRSQQLHNPQFEQDMAKQALENQGHLQAAQVSAGGTVAAAQIEAQAKNIATQAQFGNRQQQEITRRYEQEVKPDMTALGLAKIAIAAKGGDPTKDPSIMAWEKSLQDKKQRIMQEVQAQTPSDQPPAPAKSPAASHNDFSNDPAMKNNKLGKYIAGKGWEVTDKSGKLLGYYK